MTTTPVPIQIRDSTRRFRSAGLTGFVLVCTLLVACGDDSTSSSSTPQRARPLKQRRPAPHPRPAVPRRRPAATNSALITTHSRARSMT